MTYPQRFREQVQKIREQAQVSYEATAHRFGVGVASMVRGVKRVEPKLKGRTNLIGALYKNQLLTVTLFDGYINCEVFHAWTVRELLPTLPDRAVILVDNAAFHKRQQTQ